LIAEKLEVSQPTCGEHLKVLSRAGLIRGKKIKLVIPPTLASLLRLQTHMLA